MSREIKFKDLSETQKDYFSKCKITPVIRSVVKNKYKYVVQTPLGFHAGTYLSKNEAVEKILSMAKSH